MFYSHELSLKAENSIEARALLAEQCAEIESQYRKPGSVSKKVTVETKVPIKDGAPGHPLVATVTIRRYQDDELITYIYYQIIAHIVRKSEPLSEDEQIDWGDV